MDNHLWEHEDIVRAKLIVCVCDACEQSVWQAVAGQLLRLVTRRVYFVAWWWITVIACSGCIWVCIIYIQALDHIIDLYALTCCLYCIFLLKSRITLAQTQAHTQMPLSACRCIRSPPHHLNAVHLKLVWPPLSSSPYFLFRWLPRHGKCQALFASAVWLLQTFVKC